MAMGDFRYVTEVLQRYDPTGPGAAIVGLKEGEVRYHCEFGMANLEHSVPVSSHTAFHLASLSKIFTALAVVILNERGLVQFDDPLQSFFPQLPYAGVTIRHLLNHSSGIVNYYRLLESAGISDIGFTNEACLDLLVRYPDLQFSPGTKFDYSNSNYVLLGMIVERIMAVPLSRFMQEEIFQPLGMKNTLVFDGGKPIVPNRAYGYGLTDSRFFCDYQRALTTGDGTVCSSIADMCIWEKSLYRGDIISKSSLELTFTPGRTTQGQSLNYGFGWEAHRSTPSLRRLHHSGSDAGFRNLITTYPDHHLTIIILSNFAGFRWEDRLAITDCLTEALLG